MDGVVSLLHYLYESEHLVRTFIRFRMLRLKKCTPKLIDLKAAFIYIEVNIAFFKIGCTGFPNLGFRVHFLHRLPSTITDAFAVFTGQNKE